MSLSGLLTGLVEYIGDVIVNDCGVEAPERALRYHGARGMPQDCCTDKGYLVAGWDSEWGSKSFPRRNSDPRECAIRPAVQITVRYVVCWPIPDLGDGGIRPLDAEWDAKAATLADLADCVTRALIRLSCNKIDADHRELADAVLELVNTDQLTYVETSPIDPAGGCAGVLWRVYAGPRQAEPTS